MLKKLNKKIRQPGGFALLFSILVSSLLLTIGLSIFGIALKELAISTATRQSIYAFYAADSGVECIRYWDSAVGRINSFGNPSPDGTEIKCGYFTGILGTNYFAIGDPGETFGLIIIQIPDSSIVDPIFISSDESSNYSIIVIKTKADPSAPTVTNITSAGYDNTGSDRVNRTIELTY